MDWKIKNKEYVFQNPLFKVEKLELNKKNNTPASHPYYRLICPDWVNVLPVTADKQAVLISQPRIGSFKDVLELPGGAVDAHEKKDPTLTASRELEEETGYTSKKLLFLGSINPNPAIQNNRVHFFLALNSYLNPERKLYPDDEEDITVKLYPLKELKELVHHGQIDHALSALGIMLALKYLPDVT